MNAFADMGQFKVCSPYRTRETGQSFASRLASYFGCRSLKEFCLDYGLDYVDLQHGEREPLEKLAYMTGTDVETLVACTPRRISHSYLSIAGEKLNNRLNSRTRIQICPACALEDWQNAPDKPIEQTVYTRCEWLLGTVDVCHRHNLKLVSHNAPSLPLAKVDTAYQTGYLLEELLSLDHVPAEPDEYQLYALSRIGAVPARPSEILDRMPLATVAQICHAAGRDVLERQGRSGDDLERRRLGFELLGFGWGSFEAQFLQLREGMKIADKASTILKRLLEYLTHSETFERDVQHLADGVADVCFRNLPYAVGDVLLGRKCPARTLFDFRTALNNYGLPKHHLDAFVGGTPGLAAYSTNRRQDSLIRKAVADELFIGRAPFASSSQVLTHLGLTAASTRTLATLIDAGVIHPELGAATSKRYPPIFHWDTFLKDLEAFWGRFDIVDHEQPDMLSVHAMSARLKVESDWLYRMLADGGVSRLGRVPSLRFLFSIRLPWQETFDAMIGRKGIVQANATAERLSTNRGVIASLVRHGHLKTWDEAPRYPIKVAPLFDLDELLDFQDRYLSLNQVWHTLGRKSSVGVLSQRGLDASIIVEQHVGVTSLAHFFDRDKIADFIAGQ